MTNDTEPRHKPGTHGQADWRDVAFKDGPGFGTVERDNSTALCPICGKDVQTYWSNSMIWDGPIIATRRQFFIRHGCAGDHKPTWRGGPKV